MPCLSYGPIEEPLPDFIKLPTNQARIVAPHHSKILDEEHTCHLKIGSFSMCLCHAMPSESWVRVVKSHRGIRRQFLFDSRPLSVTDGICSSVRETRLDRTWKQRGVFVFSKFKADDEERKCSEIMSLIKTILESPNEDEIDGTYFQEDDHKEYRESSEDAKNNKKERTILRLMKFHDHRHRTTQVVCYSRISRNTCTCGFPHAGASDEVEEHALTMVLKCCSVLTESALVFTARKALEGKQLVASKTLRIV